MRADLRLLAPVIAGRHASLDAGAGAGLLWASQHIRADRYRGEQSLFGGSASAVLAASWRLPFGLELGAEAELGALWAGLAGPVKAHAVVSGGAFARLRY